MQNSFYTYIYQQMICKQHWTRIDRRAITMKRYSLFPKALDSLMSYVGQSLEEVLALCRGAVGVLYSSPHQLNFKQSLIVLN